MLLGSLSTACNHRIARPTPAATFGALAPACVLNFLTGSLLVSVPYSSGSALDIVLGIIIIRETRAWP